MRRGITEKKPTAPASDAGAATIKPSGRTRRFALSAGIADEAGGPADDPGASLGVTAQGAAEQDSSQPPPAAPTPPPAAGRPAAQPLPDPGVWPCETTPAGSAFSDDQWTQTEQDTPDCTIFEIIKPCERALVLVPSMQPAVADLFRRSLVVDLRAKHLVPWAEQYANAHLEHAGVEFGIVRYAIIRSASERERSPWLDGSVLRTADPGADMPSERVRASEPRTRRFATAPVAEPRTAPESMSPRSRQFAAAIERMR
ncbi:MAG TPA: hypothetical protein VN259_07460 [Xanthomonadales bacterium]|nr:hypothetical protein [Xanthomonadales bacterium]